LRSTTYSSPVDIWAIGTIIVELLTLLPLFPGESEIDEIFRICAVCGVPLPDTPSSETSKYSSNVSLAKRSNFYGGGVWPEGLRLAAQIGFKFKPVSSVPISQFIPTAPDSAIEMVADMLLYDPHKRPTASESLKYQWFEGMQLIEEVSTQKEVVKEEIASPKTAVLKQTIPKHNESESEYTEQESLISMIIPKARIQTKSQLYDTPIIHEPIKSQPTGTKAKHYDNPLKAIESKTVLQSIKAKSRQNPADQIRSSITNLLDPQRSSNAYRREEPKESPRELNPYLLIGEQKRQSQHIQKPAQKLPLIQANMHMNGMNVINQRKKSNIDRSPVKSFFTDFFKTENSPTKSNIMLIEPSYPYESTFMNTSSFQSAKKAYGTAGTTKSIEIPRTEASNEFILPPLQNVPKKQGLGNVKSGKRRSRTLFGIN
jgi:serine/threonine protein kinase